MHTGGGSWHMHTRGRHQRAPPEAPRRADRAAATVTGGGRPGPRGLLRLSHERRRVTAAWRGCGDTVRIAPSSEHRCSHRGSTGQMGDHKIHAQRDLSQLADTCHAYLYMRIF
jgi:hypothetical protein